MLRHITRPPSVSAPFCSRTGVAFALAEQSRGRLQKHLDKLIPTLYRYTFDPNPKIASAMKQVWEALVPEPKRAIATHLAAVLKHIRDGMSDRLWRSREVRTAALCDKMTDGSSQGGPCLLNSVLVRVHTDVGVSFGGGRVGAKLRGWFKITQLAGSRTASFCR